MSASHDMNEVAGTLRSWLDKHSIGGDVVKVRIEFDTELNAARAAYYVKREFERDSLLPDVELPGFRTFKSFGIGFEITHKEAAE